MGLGALREDLGFRLPLEGLRGVLCAGGCDGG